MASKKKNVFEVEHRNDIYKGTLEKGKIKVRTKRTAQGQNTIVGIYVISEREWHNDKALPNTVKRRFEKIASQLQK